VTQDPSSRLSRTEPLLTPAELGARFPHTESSARFVEASRRQVRAIVDGQDPRLLAIVGPCSIHDPQAALAYAHQLRSAAARVADDVLVCMRVYFEKPRTTVGWKGLINDPHLDGSCDLAAGIVQARQLMLELTRIGVACATETLDPFTPAYLADLVSWTAIGARTTESQVHREVASDLELPVGFKNGTDGRVDVAIHGIQAARAAHSFLGVDAEGRVAIQRSAGNPHGHLVLRGGSHGPNYGEEHVSRAVQALSAAGCNPRVLIDCSHENSAKNHERQADVLLDVARQVEHGTRHVLGVMLESNLVAGRQNLVPGRALRYGQSITDACLDWETTAGLLERLALARASRAKSARGTSQAAVAAGLEVGWA
jgi:3-deoxy-7-phosphoheptulonate synthase